MVDKSFEEMSLPVKDLDVDHAVQRSTLDYKKVARIVKRFNPGALGVITVSRRNRVTTVIIDGMHRVQAVKEITTNAGEVLCHVFKGLTKAEEAQMFLDLNAGTQPSLIDKFKVRREAGDEVAEGIATILNTYGWSVGGGKRNNVIQCIGAIENIYRDSEELELDNNVLRLTIKLVTTAWGSGPDGVQAVLLQGISEFLKEFENVIDLSRLQIKLTNYKGGPNKLVSDAHALAASSTRSVVMAIAERITDEYNKGKREATALPAWRRRQRKRARLVADR